MDIESKELAPCLKLRLKAIRMYKDLPRDTFAASLGISLRKYADCENEKQPNHLSNSELDSIVNIYNINRQWLYYNDGNMDDNPDNSSLKIAYRATFIIECLGMSKDQIAHDLFIRKMHLQYMFIRARSRYQKKEKEIIDSCWGDTYLIEAFCNYFKLEKKWFIKGEGDIYLPIDKYELAINKRVKEFYSTTYNPYIRSYYNLSTIENFIVQNPTANIHWLLTGKGNQQEDNIITKTAKRAKSKSGIVYDEILKWRLFRQLLSECLNQSTISTEIIHNEFQINDISKWGNIAAPIPLETLLRISEMLSLNLDAIFTGRNITKNLIMPEVKKEEWEKISEIQEVKAEENASERPLEENIDNVTAEKFDNSINNGDENKNAFTASDILEATAAGVVATTVAKTIIPTTASISLLSMGPLTLLAGGLLFLGKKMLKEDEDKHSDSISRLQKLFRGNK